MRLNPSDPDVQTLVARMNAGDIDLQPNFQRGEVWGRSKKQRLIDSILRDWHIPPIHVIENPHTKKQEVLDGQQRLSAIRDFVNGSLPIDGNIEPPDSRIASLDGLFFDDLDGDWRRQVNHFSIRVFRLVEYQPSEPGELFFRLNQPTNLTSAEQRNAFFGPVRAQIKDLVGELELFENKGLGFSNSRMAYDDVLSRAALAIERGTLNEKITAASLANLYRDDKPLHYRTFKTLQAGVRIFAEARTLVPPSFRLNKATLLSWLLFISRIMLNHHDYSLDPRLLGSFIDYFENVRRQAPLNLSQVFERAHRLMLRTYEDRSSARVADVSSVILRDATLWFTYDQLANTRNLPIFSRPISPRHLEELIQRSAHSSNMESLARELIDVGWGNLG